MNCYYSIKPYTPMSSLMHVCTYLIINLLSTMYTTVQSPVLCSFWILFYILDFWSRIAHSLVCPEDWEHGTEHLSFSLLFSLFILSFQFCHEDLQSTFWHNNTKTLGTWLNCNDPVILKFDQFLEFSRILMNCILIILDEVMQNLTYTILLMKWKFS